MNNTSTPCPTELILKYRPFAKSDFKDQLDDYIQSYINTKLKTEKTELFWKLREEPGSNEEAKAAHTQYITTRVTHHPLLVFAIDEHGNTPLHWAAEKGHTAVAACLITTGAELNATITDGIWKGWAPLHWAAFKGYEAIAEVLLDAGADVKATPTDGPWKGFTPLHLAAQFDHKEILETLLKAGAELNATVTDGIWKGWTPLQLANNDAIKALLRNTGART